MSASPQLSVRLRCLSHLRQALGADSLALDLPAGSTASDLEARVREMLPERLRGLVFRVAVNHAIVTGTAPLTDGDEVALLPPMQGG